MSIYSLMLSPTSPREVLFTRLLFLGTWLPLLWSPPFPSLCFRSDPPLSPQGAALACLDSLPFHDMVIWRDGTVPFGNGGSGVLANHSLCDTEAIHSFSVGLVYLSFFAEACAILQALCWSQVCHFSSSLRLSLCPCHSALSYVFSFTFNSLVDLAGTVCFRMVGQFSYLNQKYRVLRKNLIKKCEERLRIAAVFPQFLCP